MNYAQIREYDIANGEGIRTTLFVSGCNFHCKDCFNQEYQDFNYGKLYTADTEATLLKYISKPEIKGLSILGGDALWQNNYGIWQLIQLCDKVRKIPNKNVWLWSGFKWEDVMNINFDYIANLKPTDRAAYYLRERLIAKVDVFVDGQFKTELKDMRLKWRGSSNQRVIDVQQSISNGKIVLYTD